LTKSLAKKKLNKGVDLLFTRLQIIRSTFKPVSQVVRLFHKEGNDELKGMSVVSCRLGGKSGVDMLALMPSQQGYEIAGEKRFMVYLPTSPIPMSGGLVLIREANIIQMPDISVDEVMQIYFSMGIVVPDSLSIPMNK